jgi:hypothetical protein
VAYVYAPDRTAERPIEHLDGFQGVLQVDGYGGYRRLAQKNAVKHAFCWSMCGAASTSSRIFQGHPQSEIDQLLPWANRSGHSAAA